MSVYLSVSVSVSLCVEGASESNSCRLLALLALLFALPGLGFGQCFAHGMPHNTVRIQPLLRVPCLQTRSIELGKPRVPTLELQHVGAVRTKRVVANPASRQIVFHQPQRRSTVVTASLGRLDIGSERGS